LAYQPPASSTFLSEQSSNQPVVLFSQNKSAPAISHQPTEQAANFRCSSLEGGKNLRQIYSYYSILIVCGFRFFQQQTLEKSFFFSPSVATCLHFLLSIYYIVGFLIINLCHKFRDIFVRSIYQGKSSFLTIQLLTKFGFGHRTSKPDIFDQPTLKTVHN
jgi:hypothetical protein